MFRIPLLQRVMLREMLTVFILVLSLMVFLLVLLQGKRMENFFVGIQITFIDVLILLILLMPYLLTFIFPITVMISVFLSLFRMASDRELVALRTNGISIVQILPAVCMFGMLTCAVSLWLFLYAVPQGTENFRLALSSLASERANITILPRVFYKKVPNTVLFAEEVDSNTNEMRSIFIEQQQADGTILSVVARSGSIDILPEQQNLILVLEDGHLYRNEVDNFVSSSFIRYTLVLPISNFVKNINFNALDYDNMTLGDINEAVMQYKNKEATEETQKALRELRLERHKRFIFPVACFILALYTVPIATSATTTRNIALSLLLVSFIVYYGFILSAIYLAKSGMSSPLVVWMPNLVYLLLALRGMYLVSQEKGSLYIFRVQHYLVHWYTLIFRKRRV